MLTIEAGLAGTIGGGVIGILRSSPHIKTFSILTGVNTFTLGWTYWGACDHCQNSMMLWKWRKALLLNLGLI
jgi:hypothetical protein